jgi:NAD(P)-dependent dehydrogenase (short-subunit alcohol dehydrogenase family)
MDIDNYLNQIFSLKEKVSLVTGASRGLGRGYALTLAYAFATEWAKYRINVNAIAPGYFKTELTSALFRDKEKLNWLLSRIPLGRTGVSEDLSGTLLFLASSASDYVTGQIIAVDGGWLSG